MLFQEPQPTKFDLLFSVGGIPVRVNPFFWVVGIVLGAGGGDGISIVIWVLALFISILIHELGHAVVMRYYGETPRIALYWGGGLAISEPGAWSAKRSGRTTAEQVIISLAGPVAGFILALVMIGIGLAANIFTLNEFSGIFPSAVSIESEMDSRIYQFFKCMLLLNILWGLVNLLPVYPLDGGQISRALFLHYQPYDGLRTSLWVSTITGAAVAILGFVMFRQFFVAILFGSLAFSSYQAIQNMDRGGFGGGFGNRPW